MRRAAFNRITLRLLDRPLEPVIGPAKGRTRWRAMTAEYRNSKEDEAFWRNEPEEERTAFWQNEPESSAQHFSAPAGMISCNRQRKFKWILD